MREEGAVGVGDVDVTGRADLDGVRQARREAAEVDQAIRSAAPPLTGWQITMIGLPVTLLATTSETVVWPDAPEVLEVLAVGDGERADRVLDGRRDRDPVGPDQVQALVVVGRGLDGWRAGVQAVATPAESCSAAAELVPSRSRARISCSRSSYQAPICWATRSSSWTISSTTTLFRASPVWWTVTAEVRREGDGDGGDGGQEEAILEAAFHENSCFRRGVTDGRGDSPLAGRTPSWI